MLDSFLIRFIVIPLYLIIVLFTLLLLWKNSAASDALKSSGILLASILPVLIAVLPYLNRQTQTTNFTYALFYDTSIKSITPGDDFNVYTGSYFSMFSNLNEEDFKADSSDVFMQQKGFDLIEKGIISELMNHFMGSWDINREQYSMPKGFVETYSANKGSTNVTTINELRNIFAHNKLIARPGVLVGVGLMLPSKSKLKVSESEYDRTITISNPQFILKIEISPTMSGVIQSGVAGIFKQDVENINRYYGIFFSIKTAMTPKVFNRYSPEMPRFLKWYENINDYLSKMDWKNIESKIEKSSLNKAVDKILEH